MQFFFLIQLYFGNIRRDYVERSIKEIYIIMIKLMVVLNLDMYDYYVIVYYMCL